MIRRLPESAGDLLLYEASGTLTQEDVRFVQDDLGRASRDGSSVRLLVDAARMEEADPAAVWQDLRHAPETLRRVERLAVIGEARWQRWVTTATDALPGVEARFFEPTQGDEARRWLLRDPAA